VSVVIIYHRKCVDGLWGAACVAVHERMHHNTPLESHGMFIHGMQYGDAPLPALTNAVLNAQRLYIVDFSLPPEILLDWCRQRPTLDVVWLDHHRTAIEEYRDVALPTNVRAVLDENHSGAMLAAMTLLDTIPAPVYYVEDRDLWRWRLPESHAVNMGLGTWTSALQGDKPDHEHVLSLARSILGVPSWDTLVTRWRDAGLAQQGLLDRLLDRVRPVETPISALHALFPEWAWVAALHDALPFGRVLWVNSPMLQSEIGNKHAERDTVVCTYSMGLLDGTVMMSWRSTGGEAIQAAQALGGGGHPNAAGSEMAVGAFLSIPFSQIARRQ